jgi:photosystem II stability/assembly factor-like uncharacterized protein
MRVARVFAAVLFVPCLAFAAPPKAKAAAEPKPAAAESVLGDQALAALKARSIGPATMGGRVSTIALDPADPATFYVGLGTGGIMKTTTAGASFSAIFEKEKVAAIGAIAVAPSDAKVVWVGSGEANDRNSSSWGDGVYRSEDAGANFTHSGLEGAKTIARIVVHPTDSKTAWVAVMGDLWTPSAGRGLYKTMDAGASFKRVLAAPAPYDDRVGCGEVVIDPSNANVLFAALYARRRTPWSFSFGPAVTDGKDLGGLFKSIDAGATWSKLTVGLPKETGRIGLAVFAKNPKIVYAVVQSDPEGAAGWAVRVKTGGVFRSEDAGASFTRVNPLNPRPFYFSQIRIDPENDQRIYVLGYLVHVSDDGGKTFREDAFKKVHPDCHALVIDPGKRDRLLLGTDGGLYQSYDAGKTWDFLNRFAAGEFYRVNVDTGTPYRICGGLQDNLNWVGPSRTFTKEGIVNGDWINVGGGDGFSCVFDPNDPNVVYAESQEGELHRFNLASGATKVLKPEPNEGQPRFRFHWNAPLIGSAHEPGILYLGGNRVFRFAEKGEQWSTISPDLTARISDRLEAGGSGAETYGIVYTLAESPIKKGLLWAGTDDGKLWVTANEGKDWTDLTATLPPAAKGEWISRVEAGHKDPAVAYLAVDAHRSGSFAPLAFRTADRGKTWVSIAGNLPGDHPVKVVREDPVNPNVLYAGTEFALFLSVDQGKRWTKFGALPTVAVDDILVHPKERDLVIATHGRSLYVIDDLTPIQELTPETRLEESYLFPVRKAMGRFLLPGFEEWSGSTVYRGANPPEGALLSYWIKEGGPEPVKIEIKNAQGQTVANLTVSAVSGINRTSWDLKPTKDVLVEYGGEGSLFVRPGTYEATLTYGKQTSKQSIEVAIAPGIETR